MNNQLRHAAMAAMLITGIGPVLAQTDPARPLDGTTRADESVSPQARLVLSPTQKSAIFNAIQQDTTKIVAPPSFVASVGSPVPPAIELYMLPDGALAAVPQAKSVKYTVMQNQVVLVDPTTMRVVDVIRE